MEPKKTRHTIKVFLTVPEHETIKRGAQAAGLSVSAWMRSVCLKEADRLLKG